MSRARFHDLAKLQADVPGFAAAFAKCRPSDSSMTVPRLTAIDRSVTVWTNENGCAYCAFRPRPPAQTRQEDLWKYGTGDGAHNPITCPPYIRFLCEAGGGECGSDEAVLSAIRSTVAIKSPGRPPQ